MLQKITCKNLGQNTYHLTIRDNWYWSTCLVLWILN